MGDDSKYEEFLKQFYAADHTLVRVGHEGGPSEPDEIEDVRRHGSHVGEWGGHEEIAVLKHTIEDLQHEVFLLKKKVDDFNRIIRPVYEEAMVRLKALVAEAQEIIRTQGGMDTEEASTKEKAMNWLRRSENA